MSAYIKGAMGRMITAGDKVAYIHTGSDGLPAVEERYVKGVGVGHVLLEPKEPGYLPRMTSGRFCILLGRDS